MRLSISLPAAVLATALSMTLANAHEATKDGVTVAHPWARATPAGANVGAAYMEIKTAPGVADQLLSAASPAAGRVEIHTHIKDGDVMKMRRIDSVDLKAGASHVLAPGGDHIMLFDLKGPLNEGDLIKLTLTFAKAGPIEVEGTIEPVGAKGPHGMDHQPASGAADSSTDGKSGGDESNHGHGEHHH